MPDYMPVILRHYTAIWSCDSITVWKLRHAPVEKSTALDIEVALDNKCV
jgi:hypothetical protein